MFAHAYLLVCEISTVRTLALRSFPMILTADK